MVYSMIICYYYSSVIYTAILLMKVTTEIMVSYKYLMLL